MSAQKKFQEMADTQTKQLTWTIATGLSSFLMIASIIAGLSIFTTLFGIIAIICLFLSLYYHFRYELARKRWNRSRWMDKA